MDVIAHIVPRLPPELDGIGDYSYSLAQNLLDRHSIKSCFIKCNNNVEADSESLFPVIVLPEKAKQSLIESFPKDATTLLLHYSDYPYDPKHGSPYWLLNALRELKHSRKVKLVIMFHEFPFFFLKKDLYLLPMQMHVANQLAQLADIVLTNNSATQAQLIRLLKQPIETIAVPSNIGEPEKIPPIKNRNRWLVVFGTPGRRAKLYKCSMTDLAHISHRLGIEKIIDIGGPLSLGLDNIDGIPFIELGKKSASDISHILLESLAGIAYSSDNRRLSKSGVFAAYCAHGLVPIVTQSKSSSSDGLLECQNFLSTKTDQKNLGTQALERVSYEALRWYKSHDKTSHADFFARAL